MKSVLPFVPGPGRAWLNCSALTATPKCADHDYAEDRAGSDPGASLSMLAPATAAYLESVAAELRAASELRCGGLVAYSVQFGPRKPADQFRIGEAKLLERAASRPLLTAAQLRARHGECFFMFALAGDPAPARVGDGGDALFTRVPLDRERLPFTGGMEHMRRNVKVFKMLGAALFPWAHRLVWIDGKLRFGEEGPGYFFSEAVAKVGACAAFVGLPVHFNTFGHVRVRDIRRGAAPPALATHTRTILEALAKRPNVTDDPELLRAQVCRYRRLSRAPQQLGANLIDSAIFARDLGSPRCARLNRRLGEAWLAAVQCGSDRDQVSFPFVLERGVGDEAQVPSPPSR